MNSRRAWLVWGVGVFAYLVAVAQRTSFGVAGLAATERFDATAAALSAFTVVQLVVYAGLQIPVGIMVDRLGPRLMIAVGATLMALGQLQLAVAASIPAGMFGRVLVGAGDAMTFISVLRLLPVWFSGRRVPVLTQWTGILGQLGQLVSVIPFVTVLDLWGWSPAFLSAAALSVLALVLGLALLRNHPKGMEPRRETMTFRQTGESLALAWRQPGTRLGMWTHFSTQFSGNVFVMTWGYPFLVSAQGLDPAMASFLLTVFVFMAIACGPWLGGWVGRHPLRRSSMVFLIAGITALAWILVLVQPGRSPLWLLVVLVLVLGVGGPGSMIGFDYARTFNPAHRTGTASGIVNVGGFTAALLTMYLVGLILDLLNRIGFSGGDLYALDSFRIALASQLVIIGIGVTGVFVAKKRVRRQMAAEGLHVPPLREVLARERDARAERRRNRRG